MKKVFFWAIITGISLPGLAQREKSVGIRAGANVSQITRTVFTARPAFYAGLTGELRRNKVYAFQAELGYSGQGALGQIEIARNYKRTFSASGIRTDYITVGIMNKFAFNRAFSLMTGVSGEQEVSGNPFLIRSADIAMVAGAEYKFLSGLGLEMRVKHGLINNFDIPSYTTGEYTGNLLIGSHTNLVLQAGMVYYFKEQK